MNRMCFTNAGNFLHLSNKPKQKNEDATRNVINRYFDFGKASYLRYKELKPSLGKNGARALVKEEVSRNQNFLTILWQRGGEAFFIVALVNEKLIAQIRSLP